MVSDACRCQIVGWMRDRYEPHIPAQPEWEQADDCPVHPIDHAPTNPPHTTEDPAVQPAEEGTGG